MKKLILLCLVLLRLNCFSQTSPTLSTVYVDANGSTYDDFALKAKNFSPCDNLKFRATINNLPTGYHVCSYEWFDGAFNTYPQSSGAEITLPITKSGQIINCTATISDGSLSRCDHPSGVSALPLHVFCYDITLNNPTTTTTSFNVGCTNSATFTSAIASNSAYVPATGTYSLAWTAPNGWTNTSNGFSTVTTPDQSTSGNVSLKLTLNACAYSVSASYAVARTRPAPVLSGSNNTTFCSATTQNFAINNTLCGPVSYTWTISGSSNYQFSANSLQTITPPAGTTTVAIKAAALGGQATLTVTANYPDGTTATSASQTLYSGSPNLSAGYSINGSAQPTKYWNGNATDYNLVCTGQVIDLIASSSPPATITWSKTTSNPTTITFNQTGGANNFYFWAANQTAIFKVVAQNACGSVQNSFGFKGQDCGTGCSRYTVTPNPARNKINVIHPNVPPPCSKTGEIWANYNIRKINVYDNMGMLKLSRTFESAQQASVDISELHSGYYIVEMVSSGGTEKQKILVK